jgi:hypothetical protein
MKKIIFGLLVCISISNHSIAQENNNMHKNYVEVGYNSGIYNGSYTGGVQGAVGMFFTSFGKRSAIDFRAKENYMVSPKREAGAITVTYRLYLTKGYYIGGGFAHNHEVAFNDYLNDPVKSSMGTSKYIIHRTGVAAEMGYDFKSFIKNKSFGLYPVTNLGVSYLLMDKEPNPLITLSVGLRFGFKKIAL